MGGACATSTGFPSTQTEGLEPVERADARTECRFGGRHRHGWRAVRQAHHGERRALGAAPVPARFQASEKCVVEAAAARHLRASADVEEKGGRLTVSRENNTCGDFDNLQCESRKGITYF